jgi:Putative lumazine-binding
MLATLALSTLLAAPPSAAPAAAPPAAPAVPTANVSKEDAEGIRRAAMDYIEGWYAGDGARMERSLHPELAKRMVKADPKTGRSTLEQMSALTLVQDTRKGWGKDTPAAHQQKDLTILDVFEGAATAKLVAADWVDYLHLTKYDGEWKIVNVLWELKKSPK